MLPDVVLVRADAPLRLSESAANQVWAISPVGRDRAWQRLHLASGSHPIDIAQDILQNSNASSAQPSFVYEPDRAPNDPSFAIQYAHQITQAELAWDLTIGDPSVVVAVIGTGVDLTHPDLVQNLWSNPSEVPGNGLDDDANGFVDDSRGWDFQADDPDPTGVGDHETRVAGVLAARGDNGVGISGIAWRASIMPLRVAYESASVASAIRYAVDNGAHVINMSFGSYEVGKYGPDGIVAEALAYAEARDVVAVATAGNDELTTLRYPAAVPTVLSVAATNDADQRAAFSNFGAWIDVAAPGDQIYTTGAGGYVLANGTSFAAPYVSGVAALIRGQHPSWSAALLRDIIEHTGDKIPTDRYVGTTRINAYRAVSATGLPQAFARIKAPETGRTVTGGGILSVRGTVIGAGYTLSRREVGVVTWTTVGAGAGPIFDGELGALDAATLGRGEHELQLVVTTGAARDEDLARFAVDDGYVPGWPRRGYSGTAPLVAVDLDHDGDLEVIAASSGSISVLSHDGSPVAGWPVDVGAFISGAPAVGDLQGDGEVELVITEYSTTGPPRGSVSVWRADGSPVVGFPKHVGRLRGGATLVDLNGDDTLEVVVVTSYTSSSAAFAWHADGTVVAGWPMTLSLNAQSTAAAADLDADGVPEILVKTFGFAWVINADGTVRSGWPVLAETSHVSSIPADLDGDGQLEVVSFTTRTIDVRNADGRMLPGWPVTLGGAHLPEGAAVADLDGDGAPELIVVRADGSVHVRRSSGAVVPGWPVSVPGQLENAPVIADVDGDGRPDVIVSGTADAIYAWTAAGVPARGFPKSLGAQFIGPISVTDLDGDGRIDLLVAAPTPAGDLHALALGERFDPFALEWDSPHHDPHNTSAPIRPFAITAASDDGVRVHLTWTPPPLSLRRRFVVHRDLIPVGTSTATEWIDAPPVASNAYAYGVVVVDETGRIRARSREVDVVASALFCRGRSDGIACNDGSVCTISDVCRAGVCVGDPAPDDTECSDGNACTQVDVCVSGRCEGRDAVRCAGTSCELALCNPVNGTCTVRALPEGAACSDGDECTRRAACRAGRCVGGDVAPDGTVCDQENPCTESGVCQAGACTQNAQRPEGAPCDDGMDCTTGGACRQGRCEVQLAPDGAACASDDYCTVDSVCSAGVCVSGAPRICEVEGLCVARGRCDPVAGRCVPWPQPDGTFCDDGDPCTTIDTCAAGTCLGEAPRQCGTGACGLAKLCDPSSGECVDECPPIPIAEPEEEGCGCESTRKTEDSSATWLAIWLGLGSAREVFRRIYIFGGRHLGQRVRRRRHHLLEHRE